ncbi:hypothetical protein [Chamaesiphon sp.]|uniref:hypothetical protein n=1 Tax=Chamaesiphon sp. TaxID=2814140 RepID=UPI0035937127
MHHSEIGQIVEIIDEYLLAVNDNYPVKIESFCPSQSTGSTIPLKRGIRLIALVSNSKITVEIDSLNEDANQTNFFYYSSLTDTHPSIAFASYVSNLNFESVKSLIKSLIQISKGKVPLSDLQSAGYIGNIRVLPETISA